MELLAPPPGWNRRQEIDHAQSENRRHGSQYAAHFKISIPTGTLAVSYGLINNDRLTENGIFGQNKNIEDTRRRQSAEENLLNAGSRLFARWGFDKTSVDDIAREAGISKGAVYLEFLNKDALFKAVLYHESIRYTEDWLRRFESDPGEWSFARLFQHSIAAIQANPLMKALHLRDQQVFGAFLRRDPDLFLLKTSMRHRTLSRSPEGGRHARRYRGSRAGLSDECHRLRFGCRGRDHSLADRVPLEDSITALGQLLDRGLAPEKARQKDAGRAYLVAVVKKMQQALSLAGQKS